jgi:hypothetical protein
MQYAELLSDLVMILDVGFSRDKSTNSGALKTLMRLPGCFGRVENVSFINN